jgi:hypothetical protein
MGLFAANFDPFRGDVVYGRTEARAEYLEKFLESYQVKILQRKYGKTFGVYTKGYFINDYNEVITKGDLSCPSKPKLYTNSKALEHYKSLLEKSKYAPATVADRDWRGVAKGDKTVQADSVRTDEEWTALTEVYAVRKACKFGIEYISSFLGAKVHYALDGINLQEVVGKADRNLWTGKQGIPITTSELRYLFREWGRYRDNVNLIFYIGRGEVPAPWVSSPQEWLPYAMQRVDKYRDHLAVANAGQLKNFDKNAQLGDGAKAIPWFHDMKVGLS